MATVLLIGGIALLGLPSLSRSIGRLLVPKEWAKLCLIALVAGTLSFELGAILLAAPTLLGALGVHALEAACERLAGPLAPAGGVGGWGAAVGALLLPIMTLRGARQARRSCRRLWMEPWLGKHVHADGLDLVVLPSEEVVAMSIEGPTPQIVISRGLQSLLSQAELASVIRHEAAHLRFRHQRFLVLAVAIEHGFLFCPPVMRSIGVLRTALERWADECAAGKDADKRLVLRQALLTVAQTKLGPAVAAFSSSGTVMERLSALEREPPSPSVLPHALAYAPGATVGAALALAVAGWVVQVQVLALMSGTCPV